VPTVVALSVVYLAHFFLVPSVRSGFVERWLPLAATRYAAYNWPWSAVFSLTSLHLCVLLVAIVVLPWRARYRAMLQRLYPLVLFGIGASVAMIAQHKGWPYHIIPMIAACWMFIALMCVQLMQHQVRAPVDGVVGRVQAWIVAARPQLFSVLFIVWAGLITSRSRAPFTPYRTKTLDFVQKYTEPGDAVLYLSTSVQLIYPEMLHARRQPGSRYLWTFPIAYLFEGRGDRRTDAGHRYLPPEGREAEEARFIDDLIADVAERRPKVVFVFRQNGCQGCPAGFSMARYLMGSGFIHSLAEDYREHPPIEPFAVYVRRDLARMQPTQ
jgi:hypothetical protein